MRIIQDLLESINAADYEAAVTQLKLWGSEHGFSRLAEDVLIPLMNRYSELFGAAEEVPLARAYVAAKVTEEGMRLVALSMSPDRQPKLVKGPVVIGNIEDDYHSLGRKIVLTFLQADGWMVHDLGNDVLAETFVDKAVEVGASVIGVSAMMYSTRKNIRAVRTLLDERQLHGKIKLAVGGAAFVMRPELVAEVGGDGTCRSAIGAPALFAELSRKENQA